MKTVNEENERRRKLRKRFLFYSVPSLLTVGVFLIGGVVGMVNTQLGIDQFKRGAFTKAISSLSSNLFIPFYQPERALYNVGTAYLTLGEYEEGLSFLSLSIDSSDETFICYPVTNYVLGLEMYADSLLEESTSESYVSTATYYYNMAETMIGSYGSCFSSSSGGSDDSTDSSEDGSSSDTSSESDNNDDSSTDETKKRIDDKIDELSEEDETENETNDSDSTISDSDKQKLEEQSEQAEQDYDSESSNDYSYTKDTSKPW